MSNKDVVLKFYEEVFNAWDTSAIDKYVKEDYIQHNPTVGDGREGFKAFTERFFSMKPHMDIVKCVEEDDYVFVFFKCTLANGSINKVCDIYRLEGGMVAEHWDVVEHNVENIKPINSNGLF